MAKPMNKETQATEKGSVLDYTELVKKCGVDSAQVRTYKERHKDPVFLRRADVIDRLVQMHAKV